MTPLEQHLRHLDHLAGPESSLPMTAPCEAKVTDQADHERARLNACIARQMRMGWRVPVAIGAGVGAFLIGAWSQHDPHAPPAILGLLWGGLIGQIVGLVQTRARVERWRDERDALPAPRGAPLEIRLGSPHPPAVECTPNENPSPWF